MSLPQLATTGNSTPERATESLPSAIVQFARPESHLSLWAIVHAQAMSMLPDQNNDTARRILNDEFFNPQTAVFGLREGNLLEAIVKRSARQTVLEAVLPGRFEDRAVGMARVATENGVRLLDNLYVADNASASDARSELIKTGLSRHGGQPVYARILMHDTVNLEAFSAAEFEPVGVPPVGQRIGKLFIPQLVMRHPGSESLQDG